jgi:predicted helicase
MIGFYNGKVDDYEEFCRREPFVDHEAHVDAFVDLDSTKVSWNRADKNNLSRGVRYSFRDEAVVLGSYRPFSRQHLYFDRQLNDMIYQLPKIFPTPEYHNFGLYIVGVGAMKPFAVIAVNHIPDLNLWGSEGGQFFPRYTYEQSTGERDLFSDDTNAEFTRVDNITDEILANYRSSFGPEVSKDEIFHYIYGLLLSLDYRAAYTADLKKMLPRIPKVATAQDFNAFAEAGQRLANLHIGYESVEPYTLHEVTKSAAGPPVWDFYRVQKMAFGKTGRTPDTSTIIYNSNITLTGIPAEAYEYALGSRSAIEWIMERYQIKTDKASGIVNDPNDWATETGDPRYILDLLKRVVTVSVETMKIVKSLPSLTLIANP